MLKKHNQLFLGIFLIVDAALVFIAWVLAYQINFHFAPGSLHPVNFHIFLSVVTVSIYILVFKLRGLYASMRTIPAKQELVGVVKAASIAVMVTIVIFYFVLRNSDYFNLIFIYFWLVSILLLVVYRVIFRKTIRYLRKKGYNLRHVLIIGTGDSAIAAAHKIKQHLEFGFNIAGFLSRDPREVGQSIDGIKILGSYHDLKQIINSMTIDQVFFALPAKDERMIRPMLGHVDMEGMDIRIVLDLSGFFTLRQTLEDFDGLPVINLRESPFYGWARFAKRLFDIVFSFLALIIFSPVMFLAALLIWLTSGLPVFYKQERIGLDGKRFTLLKFRTMHIDAEKRCGPVWAERGDARVTRIGAILRKWSIDELPQICNILLGDMSVIGPRPERPVFVEEFRKHIPQYILRHKVKTGMTGWAQIHGCRGNTSLEKRIAYDLYYIEHWSMWLDLKILCMTIPAVIKGDGAH